MKMKNILALLTALFLLVGCLSFSVMAAGSNEIEFKALLAAAGSDPADPEPGDIVIPIIPVDPVPPQEEETDPTDVNGDEIVNSDDAVYLLLYAMFGDEDYPLPAGIDADFDSNNSVDSDDAIYLLLHIMFGEEDYPLYPAN